MPLSPDERAAIEESKAAAAPGEFASDERAGDLGQANLTRKIFMLEFDI